LKKTILVIDTKLVYYFQYHRHKHPFNCFSDVAEKVSQNIVGNISKVVWVRDEGQSKRAEFYPEYKAHRQDAKEKESSADKARRAKFEKIYADSKDFLRNFGSVISIKGYEADDLANIIAERYADDTEYNVVLVSSDEDWGRFLYADNIKMLHYGRSRIIERHEVEEVFGFPSDLKLFVDAITGVGKENVDGIYKAGKGRVKTALKECDYNESDTITLLDEWCDIHKYGLKLPEWANSVSDVLERNTKILSPYSIDSFTDAEDLAFKAQWSSKVTKPAQEVMLESIENFSQAVQVTPEMSRIFRIF